MKKRMATLAIVGAVAVAAMAPATVFARDAAPGSGFTAVTYNADGLPVTTDGHVVAMIPATVTLPDTGTRALNVSLQVANADGEYVNPDAATNPINAKIQMSVTSTNEFKVTDGGLPAVKYQYTYTSGSFNSDDNASGGVVGTFDDATSTYALNGTVGFTSNTPDDGTYSDTLTFSFAAGA